MFHNLVVKFRFSPIPLSSSSLIIDSSLDIKAQVVETCRFGVSCESFWSWEGNCLRGWLPCHTSGVPWGLRLNEFLVVVPFVGWRCLYTAKQHFRRSFSTWLLLLNAGFVCLLRRLFDVIFFLIGRPNHGRLISCLTPLLIVGNGELFACGGFILYMHSH